MSKKIPNKEDDYLEIKKPEESKICRYCKKNIGAYSEFCDAKCLNNYLMVKEGKTIKNMQIDKMSKITKKNISDFGKTLNNPSQEIVQDVSKGNDRDGESMPYPLINPGHSNQKKIKTPKQEEEEIQEELYTPLFKTKEKKKEEKIEKSEQKEQPEQKEKKCSCHKKKIGKEFFIKRIFMIVLVISLIILVSYGLHIFKEKDFSTNITNNVEAKAPEVTVPVNNNFTIELYPNYNITLKLGDELINSIVEKIANKLNITNSS